MSEKHPQIDYMVKLIQLGRYLLAPALRRDGVYADFTAGNGNDTLFLAASAPEGLVLSFDIQPEATERTRALLERDGNAGNVRQICGNHARAAEYFDMYLQPGQPLDGGIFNLGWLPGGGHWLTTNRADTLTALQTALARLAAGGIIIMTVYPGHDEGRAEGGMLREYLSRLELAVYDTVCCSILNSPDSPYVLGVQRKK